MSRSWSLSVSVWSSEAVPSGQSPQAVAVLRFGLACARERACGHVCVTAWVCVREKRRVEGKIESSERAERPLGGMGYFRERSRASRSGRERGGA